MEGPSFSPDPSQTQVLDHPGGTLLITGPAGTGKTAVLRERFARLIAAGAEPERVAAYARVCGFALRDARLPLPAGGVCISPWVDLTCSGASYRTRAEADPIVQRAGVEEMARAHVGRRGQALDVLAAREGLELEVRGSSADAVQTLTAAPPDHRPPRQIFLPRASPPVPVAMHTPD